MTGGLLCPPPNGLQDLAAAAASIARPQSSIAGAGGDPILLFALIAAVSVGLALSGHLVLQRQLRGKRRSIVRHLQQ